MILPDVNVLLYAFRADSENHARYKDWLETVVNGQGAYAISPQALSGVIRISTHPRIFARPSSRADAFSFCRQLLEQTHATIVAPGDRHWEIFEELCETSKPTGNLIQDAWFAALAIEAGCEWITSDRDFARFPGLTWRAPF
ncbi:MAG TPA: type II toxin-antitoxin system VapC family toxin [Steroidobacteraceae bacterium]|nr:type II toxin-antitoxin system VapC family toxin [Steroidobacteraceae bacterium]